MDSTEKVKKPEFTIRIKEIKVKSFRMDNELLFDQKNLLVGFRIKINLKIDNSMITITPTITYKDNETKKRILSISVLNRFLVNNLHTIPKKLENGKEIYDIPEPLLDLLVSLSLSHVRGLMVKETSNTRLEKYILPLIPVKNILKNKKIEQK